MAGIRSIEDIRLRCVINDETGCWLWPGSMNNSGTPITWFPPLQAAVTIGIAICFFKTGHRPERGTMWLPKCGNQLCANPAHRFVGNASVRTSGKRTPLHNAKIALSNRKNARLTEEIAAEIRASEEAGCRVAKRYGISASHVSRIRRGQNWRPIVIPNSSIFNHGA
jgi:hypothetical protein